MGFRSQDHPRRRDLVNAKCSKCGDMIRVPPEKQSDPTVMCRNCDAIYNG